MASEKSTPNTPAVGAGLNAARHGRSDVSANTPIVPSSPQGPPSEQPDGCVTSEPRSVPAQAPTVLDSAILPSDTPTLTAPEGAPPSGRPQRNASTKAPGASEPTESGTAEPKVEEKTEDEDPEGVVH